jgi:hypothetical protein
MATRRRRAIGDAANIPSSRDRMRGLRIDWCGRVVGLGERRDSGDCEGSSNNERLNEFHDTYLQALIASQTPVCVSVMQV